MTKFKPTGPGSNSKRLRPSQVLRNNDGVAAIEMGLIAPTLLLGLLLMIDVGLALAERMELDRNVRAGVQATMANVSDLSAIRDVILSTADDPDSLTVAVEQTCSCAGVAVACTDWCTADEPPSVFINISAVQDYAGLMLPAMTLDAVTHVQLR